MKYLLSPDCSWTTAWLYFKYVNWEFVLLITLVFLQKAVIFQSELLLKEGILLSLNAVSLHKNCGINLQYHCCSSFHLNPDWDRCTTLGKDQYLCKALQRFYACHTKDTNGKQHCMYMLDHLKVYIFKVHCDNMPLCPPLMSFPVAFWTSSHTCISVILYQACIWYLKDSAFFHCCSCNRWQLLCLSPTS